MSMVTGFPRAVVFDLDGTLVDSAPDIAAALAATLQDEGLAGFDVDRVKTMIGGGSRKLIERALRALGDSTPAARVDRLTDAFERHYLNEPCRATRLYPGALDLLAALAARDVGLGLCTNKPAEITDRILSALRLKGSFGAVVAGSEAMPKKPDPAMLLAVLARLAAAPGESVMIGDSAADVGSARAAGCPVVLVSFGYGGGNLVSAGPDAWVDNLAEIVPALARISAGAAGA